MTSLTADGTPEEKGVFKGLAQAPLHFHNAIAELIDNSIVATKNGKFKVHVDISKKKGDAYMVTVVDNASGIPIERLQSHVFRIGAPPVSGSPHLSEHGWGLKNVLAKAETTHQDPWELLTRDAKCVKKDIFYRVEGPLRYKLPIAEETSSDWPLYGFKKTGTIVRFPTSISFLKTVAMGRRGKPPETLDTIVKYVKEHLGVFYRGYLEGGKRAKGDILVSINWKNPDDVEPIFPDHRTKTIVKPFTITTAKGRIKLEGEYGLLATDSLETRKNRVYYYRNTQESEGVDFRVGDRVVMTRLFTEIWRLARHPSYNAFWGEFRIPGKATAVPKTLNNKTSIDFDDPVWLEIAEAIRGKVPDPPTSKRFKTEDELRRELAKQIKGHSQPGDIVEENHPCYSGAGVPIDILRDESHRNGEIYIYETKAGKLHPIDVYQLVMYWDGLVEDKKTPKKGYLVGMSSTPGTRSVLRAVNKRKDKKGNTYDLEIKFWKDFGIP